MTTLDNAKEAFLGLLGGLSNDCERKDFLDWIRHGVIEELPEDFGSSAEVVDGRNRLRRIAEFARGLIPTNEAILPSESVIPPPDGATNGAAVKMTLSLDSFLFDEEDEEQMVTEGQISRYFCRNCGSKNTEEIEFVTHSCSRERLEFIFRALLPSLRGKTVLDIGSRFGAVLFGSYFFSEAAKIIGLEMNSELCQIQKRIVEQFSLSDRISIVEAEMTTRQDLLANADVLILNNVWEWFVPTAEWQVNMWQFVRQHTKPGALIVTIPDMETSLAKLKVPSGILLNQWVRTLNPTHPERFPTSALEEESAEVKLYQVL